MKPRALEKKIMEEGWKMTRISTGHLIFNKPGRLDLIVLPFHNHGRDVPIRIEARIKSQLKRGDLHLEAKNRIL